MTDKKQTNKQRRCLEWGVNVAWYQHNTETIVRGHGERGRRRKDGWVDELNECGERELNILRAARGTKAYYISPYVTIMDAHIKTGPKITRLAYVQINPPLQA